MKVKKTDKFDLEDMAHEIGRTLTHDVQVALDTADDAIEAMTEALKEMKACRRKLVQKINKLKS